MKQWNLLFCTGMVLYILLTILDRFIFSIPDPIYIALALISIGCVGIGGFQSRRKEEWSREDDPANPSQKKEADRRAQQ